MQAEEEAKVLSKSLQSALERAAESPSGRTKEDYDKEREKERQRQEEEWLKLHLKLKEEEQRREQKLTEERQLREKQEREQKQLRQPSMEELIQSLAITHAEQTAKEETQRRAQMTIQKIFNAINQEGSRNEEKSETQVVDLVRMLLDQNMEMHDEIIEMKEVMLHQHEVNAKKFETIFQHVGRCLAALEHYCDKTNEMIKFCNKLANMEVLEDDDDELE
jgi:hypothetical protein